MTDHDDYMSDAGTDPAHEPLGIHQLGISERTVVVAALVACILAAVVHGIASTALGSLPGFGSDEPRISYEVPR